MSFFRFRRSPAADADLPDLEPGARRLVQRPSVRATESLKRPVDPKIKALAASSSALGSALDLLRKAMPNDPRRRAQITAVEHELGKARLPEDFERIGVMLADMEPPETTVETRGEDALELFHQIVFAATPMARAAGLTGTLADLSELAGVDELGTGDSLPIKRLLRAFEVLTAYAARARDGSSLMKLCIAEVIEMLARLGDDEGERAGTLEVVLEQLDRAQEIHDLEELRRQLLCHVEGLIQQAASRSLEIGEVSEFALQGRNRLDELEEALETAHDEARTDPLTGLPNRRALDEYVTRASLTGTSVGVIAMDLDHFKSVNDRYGHAGGDAALRAVAELLQGELRGDDRAFRVGGEELVVLLPDSSWQGARATAERLRRRTERTVIQHEGDETFSVTSSFGVSVWEADGDFESAVEGADTALYRAKQNGRNRVVG